MVEVMRTFWIYHQGEIRKFPNGFRRMTVTEEGYKWVTVACGRRKARVLKYVWVALLLRSAKHGNRLKASRPVTTGGNSDETNTN